MHASCRSGRLPALHAPPDDMQGLGLESDAGELAAAADRDFEEPPAAQQQGPSASDDVVMVEEVLSHATQTPQRISTPARQPDAASTPAGRAALLKSLQSEMTGLQQSARHMPVPFPAEDSLWKEAPPDKTKVWPRVEYLCNRTCSLPHSPCMQFAWAMLRRAPSCMCALDWQQISRFVAGQSGTLSGITASIASKCAGHMTCDAIRNMVLDVAARRSFAARQGALQHDNGTMRAACMLGGCLCGPADVLLGKKQNEISMLALQLVGVCYVLGIILIV